MLRCLHDFLSSCEKGAIFVIIFKDERGYFAEACGVFKKNLHYFQLSIKTWMGEGLSFVLK